MIIPVNTNSIANPRKLNDSPVKYDKICEIGASYPIISAIIGASIPVTKNKIIDIKDPATRIFF